MAKVIPINGSERQWSRQRFVLWFGQHCPTYLMVWASSLDDALDKAIDWLVDNEPGHLCDEEVTEEYQRLIDEGYQEHEAFEESIIDVTIAGDHGNHIRSDDWGIVFENPSRQELKEFLTRIA